jgi:hypothetical protein
VAGDDDLAWRRPRSRARVLAIAAVVVVAGASVGLAIRRGSAPAGRSTAASSPVPIPTTGGGPPSTFAQGGERATAAAIPAGSATTPSTRPDEGAARGELADLGDQSDPTTLARLLGAAVANQAAPAGPGASAASPGPAAVAGGPAPGPGASAVGGQRGAICAAQAVAYAHLGRQAELQYVATLRYRSEDAVALVYRRVGGRTAAVLRRRDCAGLLLLSSL